MNVSAPCSGPHSKSISGQCTATFGNPGNAPSTISSMLGCVALVSATESPSQLSPPFIQSRCTTASSDSGLGANPVDAAVDVTGNAPPLGGRGGVRSGPVGNRDSSERYAQENIAQ